MPSFFVNTSLGRGDLSLFLRNDSGLLQDGYDVRWSVYKKDGRPSSGLLIPAARAGAGEYYAPWGCSHSGGCYAISWQYRSSPDGPVHVVTQDFFVLDVSDFCPCPVPGSGAPVDCGAFFAGQVLGPGDLRIRIVDDDGLPASPYAVWWTVVDACGRPATPRSPGSPGQSLGEFYASWTVCGSGEYSIRWEWMLDQDSPLEAACFPFSVLNPPALFFSGGTCCVVRGKGCCESACGASSCAPPSPVPACSPNFCPCPVPSCSPIPPPVPVTQCCDVEVPRVVHLPTQVLPLAGAFTAQAPYSIPARVRKVAFYITYSRGVAGGFPIVRLMWGNGSEETQATVISASAAAVSSVLTAQPMRLSDLMGPVPPDDSPVSFLLETTAPGGSTTVRLLASEGGVPGLPGTIGITLTASSD